MRRTRFADRRLIPAHAGKTLTPGSSTARHRAHPRSRGENRARTPRCRRGWWLIPAHAGKTIRPDPSTRLTPAHPRSRGENAASDEKPARGRGPSPLTRGKRCAPSPASGLTGLIPAHAGKTPRPLSPPTCPRAHPRSRGENQNRAASAAPTSGSSPLTRGKRASRGREGQRVRLIPAHAGKTPACQGQGWASQAHPRSRGENCAEAGISTSMQGSSPLTRGKRQRPGSPRGRSRLIPAHAGKTAPGRRDGRGPGAHPRSRGENSDHGTGELAACGSSPLTRGKRLKLVWRHDEPRLIPAHAGKTSSVSLVLR